MPRRPLQRTAAARRECLKLSGEKYSAIFRKSHQLLIKLFGPSNLINGTIRYFFCSRCTVKNLLKTQGAINQESLRTPEHVLRDIRKMTIHKEVKPKKKSELFHLFIYCLQTSPFRSQLCKGRQIATVSNQAPPSCL